MNTVSAKRASEFVNIQKIDSRGRLIKALVPGHRGVWYEVTLSRRLKDGVQMISTQCLSVKDKLPCKGNANKICYHSLAAIMAGADKNKVKVSFCKDKESADKLVNMGGTSHIVQSIQSEQVVWMTAKDLIPAPMPC